MSDTHEELVAKTSKIMSLDLARKRLEASRNYKNPDVPVSHFVALLEEVVSTLEHYEGLSEKGNSEN